MRDFHRRSIRLDGYDYTANGLYFITICVQDRLQLFGTIPDANTEKTMALNQCGEMIQSWLFEIPKKFVHAILDTSVIMPNHIHIIIQIQEGSTTSIQDVIQWYKTMTTNEYFRGVRSGIFTPVRGRLWQRNYYERIIRTDNEYKNVCRYIDQNIHQWNANT